MKSFETLRKVVTELAQSDESATLHDAAVELIDALDRELISEDYDEGDIVVDLTDKLEKELKEYQESFGDEDEDEVGSEQEEDEEDEDEEEFSGIDDDEDEEQG